MKAAFIHIHDHHLLLLCKLILIYDVTEYVRQTVTYCELE